MALLKTSTTMLLLTPQNVARCTIPTPSHSTADWQAKQTAFFTELGFHHNRFTLLSPARSILPCPDAHSWRVVKLSHLFHGTPLPEGLTNPRFFLKNTIKSLYWLLRGTASAQTPQAPSFVIKEWKKILDLSSLAELRRLTFLGEARTQPPDQDIKNCNS